MCITELVVLFKLVSMTKFFNNKLLYSFNKYDEFFLLIVIKYLYGKLLPLVNVSIFLILIIK